MKQHPEQLKTETFATEDKQKPLQRHRRIADDLRTRKYEIIGAAEQGFIEIPMQAKKRQ